MRRRVSCLSGRDEKIKIKKSSGRGEHPSLNKMPLMIILAAKQHAVLLLSVLLLWLLSAPLFYTTAAVYQTQTRCFGLHERCASHRSGVA